ncbi:MAG: hypothetical protein JJE40_16555, partial [Vicinamibacteria bacterium]|nr:hypothetical protein [Vicinamibacteria bacterium]
MGSAADRSATRLTRAWSLVALAVVLAVACALLQLFAVRPFLPPAGHGAVREVEAASPAGAGGLRPGDQILEARGVLSGRRVEVSSPPRASYDGRGAGGGRGTRHARLVAECQVCGTCHDSDVPT